METTQPSIWASILPLAILTIYIVILLAIIRFYRKAITAFNKINDISHNMEQVVKLLNEKDEQGNYKGTVQEKNEN